MNRYLSHPDEKFKFPEADSVILKNDPKGYIPSSELVAAVNVALALGQPLLLTGEPGSGKTGLAHYLAHELQLVEPIVFNAQTVSTQKDMFYHYDALGHFHWAQSNRENTGKLSQEDFEKRLNLIRYEGLGLAIKKAVEHQVKSIVLIDEIDKAPRDLPNDLLNAIEELSFDVPEIPGESKVSYKCPEELKPIVIITSNSEKNLPDAFLRRVVYFHIEFPSKEILLQILQKRIPALETADLDALIQYFTRIRDNKHLNKNPATAELIAWSTLLSTLGFPTNKLKDGSFDKKEKEILRLANSVLAKTKDDLEKINSDLRLNEP